jgi:hypothetical protein
VAFLVRINVRRSFGDKYLIWTLFMIAANHSYFSGVFVVGVICFYCMRVFII